MIDRDRRVSHTGRREADKLKDDAIARLEHTKALLARIAIGALVLLAVIASTSTVLLWVQHGRDVSANSRATTAARRASVALARVNRNAITLRAVQQSRLDFCHESNKRHNRVDAVFAQLYKHALARAHSLRLRVRIQGSRRSTELLLSAIVPHRACARFIRSSG